MSVPYETSKLSAENNLPANAQQQDQEANEEGKGGVLIPPKCQPIGFAFSPIADTIEAATSHLADQTLVGLVSIDAPTTGNCTFNITSAIPAVVMVQPQVTIPTGFTTARVYGIFRFNTKINTPSVYISAVPATASIPGSASPSPVYARILIPPTANHPALTSGELVVLSDAVKVKSISFTPAAVKGSDTSTGTITLKSVPTVDTTVFLSVNPDYQPYFHLPPSVVVKAHSNPPQTTVKATFSSPPSAFKTTVTGQSGDNPPVESNEITVSP